MTILPLTVDGVAYEAGGRRLLSGVSFTLNAGAPTLILGPNGAGKSLLLRLCHGLLTPTEGRIRWAGGDGRRRHAMVFQRPVMLRRSALANVTFALRAAGVDGANARRAAADALDRFGMADLAWRPARVLSGGEQQRLAMARAWALRPEVLFLDEPTAFLDPGAARIIEEMIAAFSAEGVKIVMTTHNLAQARRLAQEVLFLHRGELVEAEPADAFFSGPKTEAAAAFLRGDLFW
ncbi:MAG: ATP-binding cassette domain-containing protein [Hyphomicrobiales bacterium]|nr:ATP-binding cassette domain-containing protein [Hyphomicrobiales bacterium]